MNTKQVRRIQRGLYTTNLKESDETIIKRNFWPVVALLCPNAVISHRTAYESRPSPNGLVVVTGSYRRALDLPGLKIRQLRGPGHLTGDAPFIKGLFMSSRARFLLEGLSGKVYGTESLYLTDEEVETYLEKLLLLGEDKVNEIRDLAREISGKLEMESEFLKLDSIIGTMLGTRKANLVSPTAQARSIGEPYDARRIQLFQSLFEELASWPETVRPTKNTSDDAFRNIAFFDAYFSNYIEGTEFEVDEAKEIIFENKIPESRPADAHDILGTFRIVGNRDLMQKKISGLSPDEFLELLQSWNFMIMEGRPEKRPGQFKEKNNRAGGTLFVEPGLAKATLLRGFELSRGIRNAFGRAALLMFVISEVHPFDDGNGRVTRAVVNAELISHGEHRIIVPTVFRTEYVDSLRLLSREGQARTFVRMLDHAQEFSADIDFQDFDVARERLEAWNAFESDSHTILRRPRTRIES